MGLDFKEFLKVILAITATVAGLFFTYTVLSQGNPTKHQGKSSHGSGDIYYGGQPKEFNEAQKKVFQW